MMKEKKRNGYGYYYFKNEKQSQTCIWDDGKARLEVVTRFYNDFPRYSEEQIGTYLKSKPVMEDYCCNINYKDDGNFRYFKLAQ